VLGGLAEYFGADPSLVRLAFIAVAIFTVIVPCVLLYIIAAIVIPDA
jgi:phage shock protein PspC (stress-responsive transcriptional regulator)